NSTVVIKISLPSAGFTEITLYNIMGQKISRLLNKYKTAGSFSIRYNADHLSSGIYLIVLNQHNSYTIKKIILLK
ncbi:MAG TPA: T9SS type A sorting domain-containing protein, partial [Ignavibacteria bacterium]|nr:T9SS type A sorting domain-containing protein [Ignavibacteria bacterium]